MYTELEFLTGKESVIYYMYRKNVDSDNKIETPL